MSTKTISFILIVAILGIIGFIGYNWHQQSIESVKREKNAQYEGIIQELTKQLASKDSVAKRQKATIDSAFTKLNEKDTIVPRIHYNANLKKVKALSLDSSISFLANRLK